MVILETLPRSFNLIFYGSPKSIELSRISNSSKLVSKAILFYSLLERASFITFFTFSDNSLISMEVSDINYFRVSFALISLYYWIILSSKSHSDSACTFIYYCTISILASTSILSSLKYFSIYSLYYRSVFFLIERA